MNFSKFTELSKHYHNPGLEYFCHSKRFSALIYSQAPFLPPFLRGGVLFFSFFTTPFIPSMPSFFVHISVLRDILCQWNYTIYGLLHLTSLSEHSVFEVPPHCSKPHFINPSFIIVTVLLTDFGQNFGSSYNYFC